MTAKIESFYMYPEETELLGLLAKEHFTEKKRARSLAVSKALVILGLRSKDPAVREVAKRVKHQRVKTKKEA